MLIRPMEPADWQGVGDGTVLHLRERVGQTLGVPTVHDVMGVPEDGPLRAPEPPPRGWAEGALAPALLRPEVPGRERPDRGCSLMPTPWMLDRERPPLPLSGDARPSA